MSLQSRHLLTLFITLHPPIELGADASGGRRYFRFPADISKASA